MRRAASLTRTAERTLQGCTNRSLYNGSNAGNNKRLKGKYESLVKQFGELRMPMKMRANFLELKNVAKPSSNIYSIMIDVYGSIQLLDEMEATFSELTEEKVAPTLDIYNHMIKGYAFADPEPQYKKIEKYVKIIEREYEPNAYTYNYILQAAIRNPQGDWAIKSDSIVDRVKSFSESSLPPLFLCETILQVYKARELISKFHEFFTWMVSKQIRPTLQTFTFVIEVYSLEKKIEMMEHALKQMQQQQLRVNEEIYALLMQTYLNCQNSDKILELFQEIIDNQMLNITIFNIMIHFHTSANSAHKIHELMVLGKEFGLVYSNLTYALLARAFANVNEIALVQSYHQKIVDSGIPVDFETLHILMDAFGRAGDVVNMKQQFRKIMQTGTPNENTYALLISGYSKANMLPEIVKLLQRMRKYKTNTTIVTYEALFDAFISLPDSVKSIYDQMSTSLIHPTVKVFNSMIRSLGRTGVMRDVYWVLEEMDKHNVEKDINTYNALIEVFGNAREYSKMWEIFEELVDSTIEPNEATFGIMIRAYGGRDAEGIVHVINRMGELFFTPTVATYDILISEYGATGMITEMFTVLQTMQQGNIAPSVNTFNRLIASFGEARQFESMRTVFEDMKKTFQPTEYTYSLLIDAYGKDGQIEEMEKVFGEMVESGITPTDITYQPMEEAMLNVVNKNED